MKKAVEAVMETGCRHAVNALGQFTATEATCAIKTLNAFDRSELTQICNLKPENDLVIIITDIIGEVGGRTYFVFNRKEWNCLSAKGITGGMKDSESFREAFMMELDNIISAAFISKIADAFSLKIYGAAPGVIAGIGMEHFEEELNRNREHYLAVTELCFPEADVRPLFICAMGSPVVNTGERNIVREHKISIL